MTVTELLETVRRVELRTNRLVNDTMVGVYLSHFKGRGMDFARFNPIEFDGFGNYGEFAIIKRQADETCLIFNPVEFDGIKNLHSHHFTELNA
jgi:hypothetical protein